MAAGDITKHYLISGRVQGVGFRAFTQKSAQELKLSGWVRNLVDGRVEVLACGSAHALQKLELHLRQGPRSARVDALVVSDADAPELTGFDFRKDGLKPWE